MGEEGRTRIVSEDYADLIVFYLNNPALLNRYEEADIRYMNEAFAIVHVPVSQMTQKAIYTFGYTAIPKLYGLTSKKLLRSSEQELKDEELVLLYRDSIYLHLL
jgi:hypothetical protein